MPREFVNIRSADRLIRMTVGLRGPTSLHIEPLALRRHGSTYVADAVVALAGQGADSLRQDFERHLNLGRTMESAVHGQIPACSTVTRSAVAAAGDSIRERLQQHSAFSGDRAATAATPDRLVAVTVTADRLASIAINKPAAPQHYPAALLSATIVALSQQAMRQLSDDRVGAAREILAAELGGRW